MKSIPLLMWSLLMLATPVRAQSDLISPTANWDFLHPTNGADPATGDADFATTWRTFGGAYNGPAFTVARPAPFHYGGITYFTANGLTGTTIGTGGTATAPASGSRFTAYFKTQFTVPTAVPAATAQALIDDGAVFYLDGVEIGRFNMTGTAGVANGTGDTYGMLADGASDETQLVSLPIGAISAGTHTLAVSVHNALSTSSDLGFYFRLLGSAPPPPAMIQTFIAGVTTTVRQSAATLASGWAGTSAPGGFRLSSPGVGIRTIESDPVDLSTIGAVNFSIRLYCFETSATSNFEPADEVSAKLILTDNANVVTEVSLLNGIIDANNDGKLNEEEFNPDLLPIAAGVFLAPVLTAPIPANIKSLRLAVSGLTDSTTEVMSFGGALVSDFDPELDADQDGETNAAEIFAGTEPTNPASVFAAESRGLSLNATGETIYTFRMNNIPGRRYAAEETDDLLYYSHLGSVVLAAAGGDVTVNLGAVPGTRFLLRLRPIP